LGGYRHVLSLSGGKDSTALAVYMRDRVPEMEYVFCDTRKELPETYEYLDRLEAYLGKKIARLNAERGFDHWLEMYGGLLPSSQARWCTRMLKLKPFEDYIGDDPVYSYVGIRADEDRVGYISTKPNIIPVFPFKEDGVTKEEVFRLLEEAGLGLPDYYRWRSRSGCYFCFFQRKSEWVNLKLEHPDLFELAKAYEKFDPVTGERYTWSERESLDELERPERMREILQQAEKTKRKGAAPNQTLLDLFGDDDDEVACTICPHSDGCSPAARSTAGLLIMCERTVASAPTRTQRSRLANWAYCFPHSLNLPVQWPLETHIAIPHPTTPGRTPPRTPKACSTDR